LASAGLTILYVRYSRPPMRSLLVADGLGLALFTISGAQRAEAVGLPGTIVVVMGVMTGVAGGVVRDVLTGEVPLILRPGTLYATAAIAGASVYIVLQAAGLPRSPAGLAGMATIAVLRFAAIARGWRLPVFVVREERGGE